MLIGILAGVLTGTVIQQSRAQVGVPVTDAANLAIEVVHNLEQDALTEDVVFKVLQIYISLRRLDDLAWRDIESPLTAMRLMAEAGDAFGYGREDLGALFEATFPGAAGYVEDWYLAKRDVVGRQIRTVYNYAENLRTHYASWEEAYRQVEHHRRQIEVMLGQQEAYDVLLALGVFETDEWRLMRQLMMQDLTMQAVVGSDVVNEKMQHVRALRASLGLE